MGVNREVEETWQMSGHLRVGRQMEWFHLGQSAGFQKGRSGERREPLEQIRLEGDAVHQGKRHEWRTASG